MKNLLCLFILFSVNICSKAQSFGFVFGKSEQQVEIPFEIQNDFIIVNVVFNKSIPLKFIFDTGAEHTILSKKIYGDLLGLNYDRTVPLVGADMNTQLFAFVARNVHIKTGNAVAPTQDLLILAEDYFKIDELIGEEIHGILGADLFKNLILQIDYRKEKILLRRPKNFKPPRNKWVEIPLSIDKNKPYLNVIGIYNQKKINLKLLLDTGASLSLLLYTNTHPDIKLPEKFIPSSIGMGLGGYIEGYLGRMQQIEFGDFIFNNLITNFQELPATVDTSVLSNRNGILGNSILGRFDVIINYQTEKLYLRPHRNYNKSLDFDKSGLELVAGGDHLKTILIRNIIPDSPAANTDLKKDDVIKRINGIGTSVLTLRDISRKLQKRDGKKIKIVVIRNDKKIKVTFRLKTLI